MTGCIGRGLAGGMIIKGSDECGTTTGGGDPSNDDDNHHLHKKHPHHDDNSNVGNNDKDNNSNSDVSPSLSGGDDSDHHQEGGPSRQHVMAAISCSESVHKFDALPVGDGNGDCQTLVGDANIPSHDASSSMTPSRNISQIPQQKEHTSLEQQLELKKYPFLVRCRNLPSLVQRTQDGKRPTEITYEIAELTVLNHIFMRIEHRYDTVCPFCGFRAVSTVGEERKARTECSIVPYT